MKYLLLLPIAGAKSRDIGLFHCQVPAKGETVTQNNWTSYSVSYIISCWLQMQKLRIGTPSRKKEVGQRGKC